MQRSIDELDHELMEELSNIASRGRKALEIHPNAPFEQDWYRDQTRHYERAPGSPHRDQTQTYKDLIGFDGPEGESNPFGVLNYYLNSPVDGKPSNLSEAIWERASRAREDHPGRMLGYSSPDDLKTETSQLSTFVDYVLGHGTESHVVQEDFQTMCQRANRVEDYFDRMTALF